jgi:hypothetical protein
MNVCGKVLLTHKKKVSYNRKNNWILIAGSSRFQYFSATHTIVSDIRVFWKIVSSANPSFVHFEFFIERL